MPAEQAPALPPRLRGNPARLVTLCNTVRRAGRCGNQQPEQQLERARGFERQSERRRRHLDQRCRAEKVILRLSFEPKNNVSPAPAGLIFFGSAVEAHVKPARAPW